MFTHNKSKPNSQPIKETVQNQRLTEIFIAAFLAENSFFPTVLPSKLQRPLPEIKTTETIACNKGK